MLVDPETKKRTRVGITRDGNRRQRISRASGTKLD
jgi:hypothetical protein